jgi:hypothetical protein
MWKWLARIVLGKVHAWIDGLTPAQLQEAADYINKKIGGNEKFEAATLKIVVEAIKTLLDVAVI